MFEDEFTEMLQNYPEAVSDKRVFSGLMRDLFPEQQREIHLLSAALELDIAKEISDATDIDAAFAYRFVKQLTEAYGISRANADWAVSVWCVCYGSGTLQKPCHIPPEQGKRDEVPDIQPDRKAVEGTYDSLFSYLKIPGGYGVAGFSGQNKQTMVFPGQYSRLPVKQILPRSFAEWDIQEMILLDGIEEIGEGAFYGCSKLRQAIFPDSLKRIEDNAFNACASLITAALPSSLERIGAYTFAGTGLKAVSIPRGLFQLGEGAFSGCRSLRTAALPERFAAIPHRLFSGCESLTEIELPEAVTGVGDCAFEGCRSLRRLVIPKSVQHIGEGAFLGMNPKFTLLCPPSSAAERYARNRHMTFQLID